jgi:ABC-2 type transport system permease protein
VAETQAAAPAPIPVDDRPLPAIKAYILLAGAWARSARQYRTSLALTTLAQMLTSCLDLVALLVIFSQIQTLAGFTKPETLYLYGTTRLSFAVSDLIASSTELLSDAVRLGTFDVILIRPASTLAQVMANQFTPKRFAKAVPAAATLLWAVFAVHIDWTPLKAAVCVGTVVCGTVIYISLWILANLISFFSPDMRETANSVTYGSELVTEYPFGIFGKPAALLLTFALPLAFVTWQPSLYVLGRTDPLGLPGFLRFAAPAVATVLALLTAAAWRASVRRYRSTGS